MTPQFDQRGKYCAQKKAKCNVNELSVGSINEVMDVTSNKSVTLWVT